MHRLPPLAPLIALGLALSAGCDPTIINPGEPASVASPDGFLALGFAFDNPVVEAELCSDAECLEIGPFADIEDVIVVRLPQGSYCLQSFVVEDSSHRGHGIAAGPHEVPYAFRGQSQLCHRVKAGALSYFGHVGLQLPTPDVAQPILFSPEGSVGIGWHGDIEALILAKYPRLTDAGGRQLHVEAW